MTDTLHLPHERLLELRDAVPSAAEAAHLADCPACARALRDSAALRDRLRALPALEPARDGWPALRGEVAPRRARPLWLAVAASLLAAGALAAHFLSRPSVSPPPVVASGAPAASGDELPALIARSQSLEHELAAGEASPAAFSGAQARRYFAYEDGVRQVDALLASPGLSPADTGLLWRRRVALLDGMVKVRREGAAAPVISRL